MKPHYKTRVNPLKPYNLKNFVRFVADICQATACPKGTPSKNF